MTKNKSIWIISVIGFLFGLSAGILALNSYRDFKFPDGLFVLVWSIVPLFSSINLILGRKTGWHFGVSFIGYWLVILPIVVGSKIKDIYEMLTACICCDVPYP